LHSINPRHYKLVHKNKILCQLLGIDAGQLAGPNNLDDGKTDDGDDGDDGWTEVPKKDSWESKKDSKGSKNDSKDPKNGSRDRVRFEDSKRAFEKETYLNTKEG